MKFVRSIALATGLLPLLAACGGEAPPPAAPAPAKEAPKEVPVDTSAVAEPKTLLVFARLSHPSASLKTIAGWSGLPMAFDDEVANELVGKRAGKAIDLDQPIDFIAASDPAGRAMKPFFAYSIAVHSADEAKRAMAQEFDLTPGAGGAIRLDPKKGGDNDDPGADDDDFPRRCELAPSAGASSMRFICASGDAALELLAPYLARTAPRNAYPSDLHVEARIDPLKPMIKGSRAMVPVMVRSLLSQQKMSDQTMADVVNGILGDVIDFTLDLDHLDFDAMISDSGATGKLVTKFKESNALITRLATSHPERADVPPPAFFHLPIDADVAVFGRGGEPKELDHVREVALDVLHKGIDKAGGNAADQHAMDEAVAHLLELSGSGSVFAKGIDAQAAQKALDDAKGKKGAGDRAALGALGGYGLVGIEAPAAKVQGALKELSALASRPGIQKWMRMTADNGAPASTFKSVPVPAALALPKGTVAFDLTSQHAAQNQPSPKIDPKAKGPAKPSAPVLDKPITLHVFAVPDGARTWIAYSLDEGLAAARVKGALDGAPDDKTLAKRSGLDDLKSAKVSSGGFLDVRGVANVGALAYVVSGSSKSLDEAAMSLSAGQTPVTFTMTATADPGSSARSSIDTVSVPRGAITDIVQMAMKRR